MINEIAPYLAVIEKYIQKYTSIQPNEELVEKVALLVSRKCYTCKYYPGDYCPKDNPCRIQLEVARKILQEISPSLIQQGREEILKEIEKHFFQDCTEPAPIRLYIYQSAWSKLKEVAKFLMQIEDAHEKAKHSKLQFD
jgi:septum formation topological specificity factor MinE